MRGIPVTEPRMVTHAIATTATHRVIGLAVLAGAMLGALAKLLGLIDGPMMVLGQSVAVWMTTGFLIARLAASEEDSTDGAVRASSAMAAYLGTWLLAYTLVYGIQDPGGFRAAWLNERVFFILLPATAGVVGLLVSASRRTGAIGDMALAAPLAWTVPEAIAMSLTGWQYALLAAVPSLFLGAVPLLTRGERRVSWFAYTVACVCGGAVALMLLWAVTGRV